MFPLGCDLIWQPIAIYILWKCSGNILDGTYSREREVHRRASICCTYFVTPASNSTKHSIQNSFTGCRWLKEFQSLEMRRDIIANSIYLFTIHRKITFKIGMMSVLHKIS